MGVGLMSCLLLMSRCREQVHALAGGAPHAYESRVLRYRPSKVTICFCTKVQAGHDDNPMLPRRAGVIMGSGDLACQCITQESWSEFEPHRTSKFFILGAAFVAPALHLWYGNTFSHTPCHGLAQLRWQPHLQSPHLTESSGDLFPGMAG